MKGKGCQPYAPATFTLQEIYLLLTSMDTRAVVQPEELCKTKLPITLSVMDPTSLRLVAQYLNQLLHLVRHSSTAPNL